MIDQSLDPSLNTRCRQWQDFEPYVLAAREQLPPYDERLRGYFENKAVHLRHMAASGYGICGSHPPHLASRSQTACMLPLCSGQAATKPSAGGATQPPKLLPTAPLRVRRVTAYNPKCLHSASAGQHMAKNDPRRISLCCCAGRSSWCTRRSLWCTCRTARARRA